MVNTFGDLPNEPISVYYDMNDYFRIDDFYKKVKKRQNYVSAKEPKIHNFNWRQCNKEILDYAENILKEVDWRKHIGSNKFNGSSSSK